MRTINVTQALSPFNRYDGIPPSVLEAAKQRGQRLHAAAAAYLTGTFQVVKLLPEDAGYWESLRFWIDDHVDHVYDVEPELVDERLGFVGHPDLICRLSGRRFFVVDWKTPAQESKSWRVQLGAYVHLAVKHYRHHSPIWRGMAVQPDRDGRLAKGTPYLATAADFGIFISCLNAYRFFN